MTNAEKALELVHDGMSLGLGQGSASERFITALGERVRGGLKVRGVPTSTRSGELATKLGIPLATLEQALPLDLTFDGADEVDPNLNLIKGYGRALVREKIVATASKKLVILIGPEHLAEKLVPVLGKRGRLPVEVTPFAVPLCKHRFAEMGLPAQMVMSAEGPFVSDNGNHILECAVSAISDPAELDRRLKDVPGVVGTGLFIGMADMVIVQDGDRVEVRERRR